MASNRSSRAATLMLVPVAIVTLGLAGAAAYFWMSGGGGAAGILASPAVTARPGAPAASQGPPVPIRDPQEIAAELVTLAPELTPASAEMLVRAVPNASGPGLADLGLLIATRGFEHMERDDLDEMGILIEEAYATLPPADHSWMGEYMRMLREGTLSAEDGTRGRGLLAQGVNALRADRRQRLQTLIQKAIRAGLAARRDAETRSRAELAASPEATTWPSGRGTPLPTPRTAGAPYASNISSESSRGEAYWRSRMQEARGRVKDVKAEIAALEKEAAREASAPPPVCPAPSPGGAVAQAQARAQLDACMKKRQNWELTLRANQAQRLEQLAMLRDELAAAENAIGETEDEAERDGALPGWLRD